MFGGNGFRTMAYDAVMHIALTVPHDEKRLRRTLTFVVGRQANISRLMGGICLFLGIVLLLLGSPVVWAPYVVFGVSLFLLFGTVPLAVAQALRSQAAVVREDLRLTLDDEAITLVTSRSESRLGWAGVDAVEETADTWYLMLGKLQALSVPKDLMSEAERTVFADFVSRWRMERSAGAAEG